MADHGDDTIYEDKKEKYLLKKANANLPPSNMPDNLAKLITWAGDLGGTVSVHTFWTAAIALAKADKDLSSDLTARETITALSAVQKYRAEEGGWPRITGSKGQLLERDPPTADEQRIADEAWAAWCEAGKPGVDAAAAATAWSLWYAAKPPLRLQLIHSAEQMRANVRKQI
jgi:hypothetical protein